MTGRYPVGETCQQVRKFEILRKNLYLVGHYFIALTPSSKPSFYDLRNKIYRTFNVFNHLCPNKEIWPRLLNFQNFDIILILSQRTQNYASNEVSMTPVPAKTRK